MPWPLRVNSPGPVPRERFSRPLAVVGFFCAIVAVLMLLFPKQGLLGVLGGSDDAATIRYREALLRVYPDDTESRLKVAASLLRAGSSRRALAVLDQAPARLTPEQQRAVAELRYRAMQDLFRQARPGSAPWQSLKPKVIAAARELAGADPPAWRLNQLAEDARTAGDLESWKEYDRHFKQQEELAKTEPVPTDPMAQALARGDYRAAARICFDGMARAGSIEERRQLFMKGVRTLQAGNLPLEALEAGERHLDGLSGDRATLVFLTRVSLAANQPARAQVFIRKALGMESVRNRAGSS